MNQRITIDLKKNPAAAEVAMDLEVGDMVDLGASIISKDDQTLVLDLEDITEGSAREKPAGEDDSSDDEADEADKESPAFKIARGEE